MQPGGESQRVLGSERLLIGDNDRDRIAAVLGEHMAQGRLTEDGKAIRGSCASSARC
jgi:hypothetical protein